jgi:hypothetical protein
VVPRVWPNVLIWCNILANEPSAEWLAAKKHGNLSNKWRFNMFVPCVNKSAASSFFAVLALVLSVATPHADAGEMKKKHHGGQKSIPLYVINPYQVFQTEVNGVHYFKGGSGWGFGYPDYGNLHINSTNVEVNTNQTNQNNATPTLTTAYELRALGSQRCFRLHIRC